MNRLVPRPDRPGKTVSVLVSAGSGRDFWVSCSTADLKFRVEAEDLRTETMTLEELRIEHPLAACQIAAGLLSVLTEGCQ